MAKVRIGIAWLSVALCMSVILGLSRDTGAESSAKSETVAALVAPAVGRAYAAIGARPPEPQAIHAAVRKCAHVFNYCILSLLCLCAFSVTLGNSGAKVLRTGTWVLAAAFSILDELYQTLVPGRNGALLDICIDNMGILIGMGAFVWLNVLFKGKCKYRYTL